MSKNDKDMQDVSTRKAANILHTSIQYVIGLIKRREVEFTVRNTRYRIKLKSLRDLIERNTINKDK